MSEHLTLSLRLSPVTLQRKLISEACICDHLLSVTNQRELGHRLTCKLKAYSSDSALSSPQETTSASASLLMLLQSVFQSPLHFFLIPISHSSENRPIESWNSLFNEDNKTTSSSISRDGIRNPPNLTSSATWLHLTILSMKIMRRTGEKGQPWQRQTLTGNRSDLLLIM